MSDNPDNEFYKSLKNFERTIYNKLKRSQKAIGVDQQLKNAPSLPYDGVEERSSMAQEIFNDIFEFDDIVVVKDPSKQEIIEALILLKSKAEEFSKSAQKDEKMAIAVVNIGYQLDTKNQYHKEIIEQWGGLAPLEAADGSNFI